MRCSLCPVTPLRCGLWSYNMSRSVSLVTSWRVEVPQRVRFVLQGRGALFRPLRCGRVARSFVCVAQACASTTLSVVVYQNYGSVRYRFCFDMICSCTVPALRR